MNAVLNLLRLPLAMAAGIPRAVAGMSLAGRIALTVAVFQVLVVLLLIAEFYVLDERQVVEPLLPRLWLLPILLVVTPALVYQAARLWLDRDVSRFPDIFEAWRGGMAALRRQGVEPDQVPLFLVLGARSDDEEELLLAEAPGEFAVTAAPPGDAALHVYGGPDAVFVCLATCSRLSDAVRHGRPRPVAAAAAPSSSGTSSGPTATPAAPATDIRGTVMVQEGASEEPAAPAPASAVPSEGLLTHTIDISGLSQTTAPAERPAPPSAAARDEIRERFAYLCSLLRRERGGLAPLNGIVAVVPGDRLISGASDPQVVGQALGDDLAAALATTGVRAPVVVLVLGLDREPGFRELIGRMPAAERGGRIGQRFPAGVVASYDQLGSLASRACGMVEDLVTGRMFRSANILTAVHNDRLAELVARIRGDLVGRLTIVLRRALVAPDGETGERAPFVAGCYLAACGAADTDRAFVRGVFDRLLDCQGDLEWTQQEVESDGRARRLARVLWMVSGSLLAVLGAIVLARLLWPTQSTAI